MLSGKMLKLFLLFSLKFDKLIKGLCVPIYIYIYTYTYTLSKKKCIGKIFMELSI